MSTLNDCCSPCAVTPPTQIVGAQGPAGAAGAAGADGTDAFAIVQAPGFTVPTVGNDVLAPVSNTAWMAVGEVVIAGTGFGGPVTGPANFLVISINSSTTVTLRALAYTGDVVNPATIATSALLAPAGLRGPTGTAGSTFPTTTRGDIMVNTDGVAGNAARLGIGAQGQAPVADVGSPSLTLSYRGVAQTLFTNFGSVGTANHTTEDSLMSFSVPAHTLRNTDDSLEWEIYLDVNSTMSNATKLIKVYLGGLGGSVVGRYGPGASGPIVQDGGFIVMKGRICRLTDNTQKAYSITHTTDASGPPGVSSNYVEDFTPNQDLTTNLLFLVTGTNGTAVANGIIQQMLVLNYRAA